MGHIVSRCSCGLRWQISAVCLTNLSGNSCEIQYGISNFLWSTLGLSNGSPQLCKYNATAAASREWRALTGCLASIPIDKDDCAHWDSKCIPTELMTDNFRHNTSKLSRLTVAAMEDLGYVVDYGAADPLSVAEVSHDCLKEMCPERRRHLRQSDIFSDAFAFPHVQTPAHQRALAHGQLALQEMAQRRPKARHLLEDGMAYFGDQVVFLVYEDDADGELHSIVVRKA